jgi:hypothetical protein
VVRRHLGIILATSFWMTSIEATTISHGSVADLTRESGWIGRVEVEEIVSITSSATFPLSRVKAKVLEVFQGSSAVGSRIHFEIPGGSRGNRTYAVLGFPPLKVGSHYVIFLNSSPHQSATALSRGYGVGLVGWSAFRVIEREGASAVVRVGEPTLLQHSVRGLELTHDRSIRSYNDFVSEIHRALD